MTTTKFVAKKVGDRYVLVRQDPSESANRTLLTAAGSLLAVYGLGRRSLTGFAALAAGTCMIYRGVTGVSLVNKVFGCKECSGTDGEASMSPSYQHDALPSTQQPHDEIDEASMESFPASDAPSHTRVTLPA